MVVDWGGRDKLTAHTSYFHMEETTSIMLWTSYPILNSFFLHGGGR